MATSKQIAANRRNSLQSTGPKTEAGKAASSANSLQHGLTAQQLTLKHEDPSHLESLRAALLASHQPQTDHERALVDQLAQAQWRLDRARRLEIVLFEALIESDLGPRKFPYDNPNTPDEALAHKISAFYRNPALFFRYLTRCESVFFRAIETLRRAQLDRLRQTHRPQPTVASESRRRQPAAPPQPRRQPAPATSAPTPAPPTPPAPTRPPASPSPQTHLSEIGFVSHPAPQQPHAGEPKDGTPLLP